jgi:hypothetical protein
MGISDKDSLRSLPVSIYNLALTISTANRIRRRGPGQSGLFSRPFHRPLRPEALGVLAIMKNESLMIDEWLEHYLSQGVSRIFLIDNGSTDDTVEKVERWRLRSPVELIVSPEQHQQTRHYWNAFQQFRISETCEWLAIADIDEFWFCKSGMTLVDYVSTQSDADAIYANWSNFGTSFDEHPPSVRLCLTKKDPRLSRFTKCIFRTWLPRQENDIEVHSIRNVGLNRTRIANRQLQLNHYVTKSREFWNTVKMRRGDAFFASQDLSELANRFEQVNATCTRTCTILRDLVESGVWKRQAAADS